MALILAFGASAAATGSGMPAAPAGPVAKVPPSVLATASASHRVLPRLSRAVDFREQSASPEVRHVAHWALDSGDSAGLPYLIVDKVNARVFVFDADGRLQGADAALLGMARGDGTAQGIGELSLSAIRPEDRTTPAGRFMANLDRDVHGKEVLLIDYDASLALHPVIRGRPGERRAERLESETPEDNRISYGCINVPVRFYENVVRPAFTNTSGLVYILPETSSASEMFAR